MAINPDNSLDCCHTGYCGTTGAGKGVAFKLAGHAGPRVAVFDPYGEYRAGRIRKLSGLGNGRKVHQYTTRRGFLKAFVEAWRSGKNFAVSYYPQVTKEQRRDEALWFAQLIWDASDGKRRLDCVFEEMGTYTETAGTDNSILSEIASGGRKYAIHAHWLYQRPQQVPKSIINYCPVVYIGVQDSMDDVKYWMNKMKCEANEIVQLGKLNTKRKKHFLVKRMGVGNYEPAQFQF